MKDIPVKGSEKNRVTQHVPCVHKQVLLNPPHLFVFKLISVYCMYNVYTTVVILCCIGVTEQKRTAAVVHSMRYFEVQQQVYLLNRCFDH